jgi:hypothetical protein
LREEVTAVLRQAKTKRGDEVVLVLNTGGGTVTGYGLAAAQLTRLRDAGIKLTVCVEQVAASGGYMMACCADRLVASPFAVLGSIGVISEIPNLYERLKKEGIEFQTVTAWEVQAHAHPHQEDRPEGRREEQSRHRGRAGALQDIRRLSKTRLGHRRRRHRRDVVRRRRPQERFVRRTPNHRRRAAGHAQRGRGDLLGQVQAAREADPPRFSRGEGRTRERSKAVNAARGGGWNAIRALALGVAAFAGAAGGGAAGGADVAGLGLTGGLGAGPSGGALAMDAARAAEKVMARDGRYAAVDDDEMYF